MTVEAEVLPYSRDASALRLVLGSCRRTANAERATGNRRSTDLGKGTSSNVGSTVIPKASRDPIPTFIASIG
jgi:hypothetical protein